MITCMLQISMDVQNCKRLPVCSMTESESERMGEAGSKENMQADKRYFRILNIRNIIVCDMRVN